MALSDCLGKSCCAGMGDRRRARLCQGCSAAMPVCGDGEWFLVQLMDSQCQIVAAASHSGPGLVELFTLPSAIASVCGAHTRGSVWCSGRRRCAWVRDTGRGKPMLCNLTELKCHCAALGRLISGLEHMWPQG